MRITNSELRERIGAVIRSNRLSYNMLQKDLAEKTGLTRVFINQIENGKRVPSETSIKSIAACFGKEPKDLFEEAKIGDVDERVAIALNLKKLVESGETESLRKLIEFAKTLEQ